jgi:hypothetical protein
LNGFRATQSLFGFYVSPKVAGMLLGTTPESLTEKIKANAIAHKPYRGLTALHYGKQTISENVSNVLGLIEGTDKKDEYVVITAHYDHVGKRSDGTIYYGADDDGSGTTGILELAEAFTAAKAAGKGPRRSILLMTVSGEEKGLWGSQYYSENPIFPLEKTTVDLNIDMIGRIGSDYLKDKDSVNYVYTIGDDKLSSDLAPITDQVNDTYTKMKLDRRYNDPKDPNRFYYRSDHYNFAAKGVPIIFYFNGVHADYHKPTDTPDKINYPLMAKRAQLVFHTAWEIANREEMLKRDMPLGMPPGRYYIALPAQHPGKDQRCHDCSIALYYELRGMNIEFAPSDLFIRNRAGVGSVRSGRITDLAEITPERNIMPLQVLVHHRHHTNWEIACDTTSNLKESNSLTT